MTEHLRGAALAADTWRRIIESETAAAKGDRPTLFWDQDIWIGDSPGVLGLSAESPKNWAMTQSECNTAACFAGFAVYGRTVEDPFGRLVTLDVETDLKVVDAAGLAAARLQLKQTEADELFRATNSLEDIRDWLTTLYPGIELVPIPEEVTRMYETYATKDED